MLKLVGEEKKISIHALVKRATPAVQATPLEVSDFNPRPREEGDDGEGGFVVEWTISIHALVKRATYRFPTRGTIP